MQRSSASPRQTADNPANKPADNTAVVNQLLQTALDNLVDGLLIVTAAGRIVQQNTVATEMCQSMQVSDGCPELPESLWTLCQPVFKNLANGLKTHFGLENDIADGRQRPIRVRVQVLDLAIDRVPCLLLVLEDRQAAYHRQAVADRRRFRLTPREQEVWELRLQGASYEAIATTLWIAENTVKKHMKSILAKRRAYLEGGDALAG
ncbi:MAG: LuxR C-terminal-related transcriptional regulator [Cyanobacteria bacterium J06628_6]